MSSSLLIAAACTWQSCTSDSPDINTAVSNEEIKFETSDLTRATVSSIDYAGSEFSMFGDRKFSDNSPAKVFENTGVRYDGSSWSYAGVQYWYPGQEHSFVTIHPSKVFNEACEPQYSDSRLSFEYALPVNDSGVLDKDGIFDLLVATHRRMYASGVTNTPVSLRFGHLMSLVNLAPEFSDNILSDEAYILIHKLELSGINTKSAFDVVPAQITSGNQTDDMIIDVQAKESGKATVVFPTPVQIKNHSGRLNLFTTEDSLIMLPQSLPAGCNAEIILFYSVNDDTDMIQVSLPLSGLDWETGRRYVYNFTIERTGLSFDKCEISPWNEVKGDDIIVE